jgi:hypothetical protein
MKLYKPGLASDPSYRHESHVLSLLALRHISKAAAWGIAGANTGGMVWMLFDENP